MDSGSAEGWQGSASIGTKADDDLRSVKTVSAVCALLLLFVYACMTRRHWLEPSCSSTGNCGDEVFLRLAIFIGVIVGLWLAARHVWVNAATYRTNWWNRDGKLDSPSWDDVLKLTVTGDPLDHKNEPNFASTVLKMILAYVALGSVAIESTTFLFDGPIIPRLLSKEEPGSNGLSANLTALLALLAAAASIHFTYRQLQAKVKADSRQAWIDKLRSLISRFIALADNAHSTDRVCSRRQDPDEFTTCRIEMELMLNPSERDHRMLMYLSIRLAFFALGEKEFRSIEDVKNIRAAIGIKEEEPVEEKWLKLFGPIPSCGNEAAYRSAYSDLIGYTLRLAHVVLKREWERVKVTR